MSRALRSAVARRLMQTLVILSLFLILLIFLGLLIRAWPILSQQSLGSLLGGQRWRPMQGKFGFAPFITGTLWVTVVSLLIAVPLCLLTAIYLSEYAHSRVREWLQPLIDILAGIPSVVFGVFGLLVVVPFVRDTLAPRFGAFTTGYSVLTAAIVLAIMIIPVIVHVALEVLRAVPFEMRDAALALGATRWQVTKKVVLRKAMPGILAAVVLGLSRAFGETMAVMMVAGNVPKSPHSLFDPAYPLPALIANNYGEMMSIPLYDSALMLAALILLVIVIGFNALSAVIQRRITG
ncbi:MAG TPA: phosphate ABC transporter permease subunit PstC, partial [Candidatus Aminicenantes bacterium]|nr:phosphate ABC transporter permease subunit PstC [Candidatus Aminicenantes bacterium]